MAATEGTMNRSGPQTGYRGHRRTPGTDHGFNRDCNRIPGTDHGFNRDCGRIEGNCGLSTVTRVVCPRLRATRETVVCPRLRDCGRIEGNCGLSPVTRSRHPRGHATPGDHPVVGEPTQRRYGHRTNPHPEAPGSPSSPVVARYSP
jgi:hypothetical protein